jgi:hypothetical protein
MIVIPPLIADIMQSQISRTRMLTANKNRNISANRNVLYRLTTLPNSKGPQAQCMPHRDLRELLSSQKNSEAKKRKRNM